MFLVASEPVETPALYVPLLASSRVKARQRHRERSESTLRVAQDRHGGRVGHQSDAD